MTRVEPILREILLLAAGMIFAVAGGVATGLTDHRRWLAFSVTGLLLMFGALWSQDRRCRAQDAQQRALADLDFEVPDDD